MRSGDISESRGEGERATDTPQRLDTLVADGRIAVPGSPGAPIWWASLDEIPGALFPV